MKIFKISFVFLLLILLSCDIDHGLEPQQYLIKGNILFYKGEAPPNTDRIEVFALKEFPPQDPQNFLYLGQSGSIDFQGSDTVAYEINVSPTSYQLIGLVWKEKKKDWNLTGLMGIYTGELTSIFPDSVVVSKENPIVENVNIYANWERVSNDARVEGNITYKGEWHKDTALLLLAIYPSKPTSEFTYFSFENVDYAQPIFVNSSDYSLPVSSGNYNYIVLYWVGKKISKLSDLIELGVYEKPGQTGTPGTIHVESNSTLENIDIHVNFNIIIFP